MSSFDNSHLTALTDLINSAVKDIIAEYAAVGRAVPNLDSLEPGPFDVPEETPAKLSRAVQIIEAACAQLAHTVASPGHVVVNKAFQHEDPACLLVVTEAKIADLLLDKPDGVHVDELAKSAGLDAGKLERILRVLATKHCFREVKPGVFANNRLSLKLLSTDIISSTVSMLTDESMLASAYLNETMTNPSEKDNGIPLQRATGHALFDYYNTPQGKKQGERFSRAMIGSCDVAGKGLVAKAYPWASIPADSVICDVGGGNGHITMGLIKVHPHLRVVLQDQAEAVEQAREFWGKTHSEALREKRVEFVPFDLFKDAAVEGCEFYYISNVLHDWPDAESITILRNVRKAMKPSSKLIIDGYIVRSSAQDPGSQEEKFDYAPEPLLPNWGAAQIRTYHLDVLLMNLCNGRARSASQYVELCKQCDLKFNKLYPVGETYLLEFVPV